MVQSIDLDRRGRSLHPRLSSAEAQAEEQHAERPSTFEILGWLRELEVVVHFGVQQQAAEEVLLELVGLLMSSHRQ